jgi:hypothetical protein
MTDTRRSRSERDSHIAKVIPLRRTTLLVDQPASDLSGLVQRAGTTFTELVAMAEDYGLDVPQRVQLAAVLLDVRLMAAATTPPQGLESASSPGTFERTQDGLQWAEDLDSAVGAFIELWRCNLDRREFLGAMGALAVITAAGKWCDS